MSLANLLLVAVVLCVAAGTAALWWLLRRGGSTRVGLGPLAAGVGVAAAASLVVTPLLAGPLGPFGLLHVAYLGAVVGLPLLAVAGVGVARWLGRPTSAPARVALSAMALLAPLGIYMTHVEPSWLRVDRPRAEIPGVRDGDARVTVGVLADLQTAGVGDHERDAVERLVAAEPDLIVLPGDVFHGPEGAYRRELPALRELLAQLHAPAGVFVVQGDTDGERLDELVRGTGVQVLDDRVAEVVVGDRRVLVGGTRLDVGTAAADRVRERLLAEPDDGALTLLLSHRPDTVLELPPDSRVDLTVAGHTHGGQVVLPVLGPPITLTEVPDDVARGGLHAVDGNAIYVSPGVGLERGEAPQLRLLSRPAIALVTLAGPDAG